MPYSVISKTTLKKVKGHNDFKIKYIIVDEGNNAKYCILKWNLLGGNIIVYDYEYDDIFKTRDWSYNKVVGYVYNTIDKQLMHKEIARLSGIQVSEGYSIDHINCIKLDNRRKNLRAASQGEQNSNRASRSDKLAPCDELRIIGVSELPKHVRWDATEEKFVIEKHPQLLKEVSEGTRKKPVMSGTKSKKASMVEKYQDILARLDMLNQLGITPEMCEFQHLKHQNMLEYEDICECILKYEGVFKSSSSPMRQALPDIIPQRRTVQNRKNKSNIPLDSGVNIEDLPKYCHYQSSNDTRGDSFVIRCHPSLLASGKTQWATTSCKNISTHDKFIMLIDKYEHLSS